MSANILKSGAIKCSMIEEGNMAQIYKNDIIVNPNLVSKVIAGGRTVIDGKYAVHNIKEHADTYFYTELSKTLYAGDTVTFSCDAIGFPNNTAYCVFGCVSQNSGLNLRIKNGHNVCTFAIPSSTTSTNKIIYDDTNWSGVTRGDYIIYLTNIKLEEGSIATPWIPNEEDPIYTSLEYSNMLFINPVKATNFYEI